MKLTSLIMLALIMPLQAAPPEEFSLMFMADEIKEALNSQPASQEKIIFNGLFLNGIIFMDPNSWVVWLNGERYASDQQEDVIEIQKVTPSSVELIWETKGKHHTVKLSTNQTYDAETGQTLCGDCRARG